MGDKITLKIDERTVHGKKVKTLRQQGITPAVVYGHGLEPLAVQAEAGELRRVVLAAGKHTPVNLTGAKRRIAMIKDVEFHPTKAGIIRHVSFHAVKADEPVNAEVPVRLVGVGESAAEKAGLIVLQSLDNVEVKALPMDLPSAVEIDITALAEAGEKITLGDAKLPSGVQFVEHETGHHDDEDEEKPSVTDLVVASVYEPAALEAANDAAAGDATDESEVEAEHGTETTATSEEETRPGGKSQDEPKQSNVDANK